MLWVLPRSTCSHCGSANCDDQRVPVFPSTAAEAGVPAPSIEEAVAVLFNARFVPVSQVAAEADRAPNDGTDKAASNSVSTTNNAARGRAKLLLMCSPRRGVSGPERAPSGQNVAHALPAVNTNPVPELVSEPLPKPVPEPVPPLTPF